MLLAVDAGGTKTDYLLADPMGRELGRVRGGCIKRMRVDAETAAANLELALRELENVTGTSLQEVVRTCVGTAGDTVPLVVDWLKASFPTRVAGELIVVGDVEVALDAAFQGGPGVLVLAGTGSNVAARDATGSLHGAGGWGPLMADQGSANRIGLNGLRAGFLARDEGRATELLVQAKDFWRLQTDNDLIAFANSIPPPDFSQLAQVVHRCAMEGDAIAGEVLREEGKQLGYLVRLVLRRLLGSAGREEGTTLRQSDLGVAFAGSIMEKVKPVRQALMDAVHTEFPEVHELSGVVDPLQGALWRARTSGIREENQKAGEVKAAK